MSAPISESFATAALDKAKANEEEEEQAMLLRSQGNNDDDFVSAVEGKTEDDISSTNNNNNNMTVTFVDHFSLKAPSSSLRLRDSKVQVYELANDQLQLEHKQTTSNSLQITLQRTRGGSLGLRILRVLYTVMSLLMIGFLFVFSTQLVIFQMMEIPKYGGTSTEYALDVPTLITALVSLPLLIYSMSSLMVMAMVFVSDNWNGHVLFGLLLSGDGHQRRVVAGEWITFLLYICVPLVASMICFLAQVDRAGDLSLIIWYCCVNITFFLFCALVLYHEVKNCFDLTKIVHEDSEDWTWKELLKEALLTTITQRYAGRKSQGYVTKTMDDIDMVQDSNNTPKEKTFTWIGLYSRTTRMNGNPFFNKLDPPVRRYAVMEIRERVSYATNYTWSLEKMCCKLRHRRSRLVLKGPNALEPPQYKSTLACSVIVIALFIIWAGGLLSSMGQSTMVIVLVVLILAIIVGIPCVVSAVHLYQSMPTDMDEVEEDDGDLAEFQTWKQYTIAKPKEWYCWFRLTFDIVIWFLWPTIAKFVIGLPINGVMFIIIGLCTGVRRCFDASFAIKEYGTMSKIDFASRDKDKDSSEAERKAKNMIQRSRATELIGKITWSPRLWMWNLGFLVASLLLFFMVIVSDEDADPAPNTGRPPIRVLDDFYYPPQVDVSYPACRLGKVYKIPGRNETHMPDYNMLAALAYETTNVTDYILDKWWQEEDFFVDETPLVDQWKIDSGNEYTTISFKFFSIPSQPGFGVVSIRGTEIVADRLLNAQLFASSVLTQIVERLLPFAWIFEPVFPDLLQITTWIGSESLKDNNYYSVITDFVNDMYLDNYEFEGRTFDQIRITGVSLGGGLAMIAGAQTGAYAIAFAGPNPVLSRKTLDPPVSLDELNTRIMNVVPDTDFVSHIGHQIRQAQQITCRDWDSQFPTCHAFWRQMCEFMYSCGSIGRPVVCNCVEDYGYPEPFPNGKRNRTYAEACLQEEALVRPYMGE